MKLSQIARNILTEALSNGGIRLTHSYTASILERRGALRRNGDTVTITEYGKRCLQSGQYVQIIKLEELR